MTSQERRGSRGIEECKRVVVCNSIAWKAKQPSGGKSAWELGERSYL